MNSDEFSNLIGLNYGIAAPPQPLNLFAMHIEDENSHHTSNVMEQP